MNTLDMDEIKARTYRDAFCRDGLSEMSAGVLFLCLAYLFDYLNQFGFGLRLVISPLVTGMAILPVLFIIGGKALEKRSWHGVVSWKEIALAVLFVLFTVLPLAFFLVLVLVTILYSRNRVTTRRIGYVSFRNELSLGLYAAYAGLTLSPVLLLLSTNLLHATGARPLIYRISPLLLGLSLFVAVWFAGERTRVDAFKAVAIALWFTGMGFAASPLAETERATVYFGLLSGIFLLGAGLVRLIRFLRSNPLPKEETKGDTCQPAS